MKNLIILIMLISFACSQPVKPPMDVETSKKEVTAMLDQFHNAMANKDAPTQMSLLTEDGTFCGTDPGEVWDKKTLTDYMTKAFADTALVIKPYAIDKREIKIDDDGQCAFILDQFTMDVISEKIPIRFTAHAVKQNDKWMIDFSSMALIPKNEDMVKLNESLK